MWVPTSREIWWPHFTPPLNLVATFFLGGHRIYDKDGEGRPQYIQCYREIATTTMDKNGEYTTINLMSDHQIAAAIADDGTIREYCDTGRLMRGWFGGCR
eukprot:scaffold96792_cov54-Cyclotella_meneghiniana.AAC.1